MNVYKREILNEDAAKRVVFGRNNGMGVRG